MEVVGVRYVRWIEANDSGSALYTPIDRVVRAVGRIVVWVQAEADVRMEAESKSIPTCPRKLSPNSSGPIAANTSAPGVRPGSSDSSLQATAVSQPQ
ncbi:Uncharacterised protein [Mycobacteroides abscessus subsp. massiliense]|nr:Uncharacterised protein [Mycobacteroides abscessus subsp. massiliense]